MRFENQKNIIEVGTPFISFCCDIEADKHISAFLDLKNFYYFLEFHGKGCVDDYKHYCASK